MDLAVAKLLVAEGFLKSADKKVIGRKNFIEMSVAYKGKTPALTDFKLVSKPSRHLYKGYEDIKLVRQTYGIAVLSTPKGILTGRAARKEKVGGEYLFEIW
jgi:small subunit ribosomal protein S8